MDLSPENLAGLRNSPVASLRGAFDAASRGAIALSPIGFRSILNLRGEEGSLSFLDAVSRSFGLDLPVEPNRWVGDADRSALWLGPDEWMLFAPDGWAAAIEDALRAALPGDPWLSVVDVSHNYCGFRLSGAGSRDVLAKGCALDLHPRVFNAGGCAQTLLAKSRVILRLLDDEPCFELWVRNSFARYLASWLLDAMAGHAPAGK